MTCGMSDPSRISEAAERCGEIVDPGADYPHPCVLPEGHDGPHDGRPPEMRDRSAAKVRAPVCFLREQLGPYTKVWWWTYAR